MKQRFYLYILTAIVMVVAVAAGVMRGNAHSSDPTAFAAAEKGLKPTSARSHSTPSRPEAM